MTPSNLHKIDAAVIQLALSTLSSNNEPLPPHELAHHPPLSLNFPSYAANDNSDGTHLTITSIRSYSDDVKLIVVVAFV